MSTDLTIRSIIDMAEGHLARQAHVIRFEAAHGRLFDEEGRLVPDPASDVGEDVGRAVLEESGAMERLLAATPRTSMLGFTPSADTRPAQQQAEAIRAICRSVVRYWIEEHKHDLWERFRAHLETEGA